MDNLAASLGQLSTSAKEWKPGKGYSTPTEPSSPARNKQDQTQVGSGRFTEFHPQTPPNLHLAFTSAAGGASNVADAGVTTTTAIHASPQTYTVSTAEGGNSSNGLNKWNPETTKEFVPKSTTTTNTTITNNNTAAAWSQQNQHQHLAQDQKLLPPQAASTGTTGAPIINTQNNPWFGPSPNINTSEQQQLNVDDGITASTSVPSGPVPSPLTSTFTSNSAITPPIPRSLHSLGLPTPTLWSLYRNMTLDCNREMTPTDQRYKAIPSFFGKAMPLEQSASDTPQPNHQNPHQQQQQQHNYHHPNQANHTQNVNANANRSSFGYPTAVFKVTSRQDGHLYCLRRFDSVKCVNQQIAMNITATWTHATTNSSSTNNTTPNPTTSKPLIEHPALVTFYRCFHSPTHRALFFVHHYHPSALTLREHVHGWARGTSGTGGVLQTETKQRRRNGGFPPLVEETIWSYATQLASGVRAVHGAGLACRVLSLGHVLVTPEVGSGSVPGEDGPEAEVRTNRVRLRINCLGVADALEYEARKQIPDLQKRDVRALGRILLSLASGTEIGGEDSTGTYGGGDAETLGRCDAFLRRNYSRELRNLILALVAPPTNQSRGGPQQHQQTVVMVDPPKIEEVCRALASKAMDEMDSVHAVADGMEEVLGMEFESGRALRLLLKMGCVNERPEFGVDRRWSETGDCYVLKLFRDYVFHQADAAGRPVLDLGHMVTALNKLDASDEEKIVLTSRDGKSIMVVSFADVARCLQNAYAELCNTSVPHQHMRLLDDGEGNVGSGPIGY